MSKQMTLRRAHLVENDLVNFRGELIPKIQSSGFPNELNLGGSRLTDLDKTGPEQLLLLIAHSCFDCLGVRIKRHCFTWYLVGNQPNAPENTALRHNVFVCVPCLDVCHAYNR